MENGSQFPYLYLWDVGSAVVDLILLDHRVASLLPVMTRSADSHFFVGSDREVACMAAERRRRYEEDFGVMIDRIFAYSSAH
jgi:hypothetical protein